MADKCVSRIGRTQAATTVQADTQLTVDTGPRFVSRGGEKLDAALELSPSM